jgi:hypothetical protein
VPYALGPPRQGVHGRTVRCFSTITRIAGRPWASNLSSALRMDDANPTVSRAIHALPSMPTTGIGRGRLMRSIPTENVKRRFCGGRQKSLLQEFRILNWTRRIRVFRTKAVQLHQETALFYRRAKQRDDPWFTYAGAALVIHPRLDSDRLVSRLTTLSCTTVGSEGRHRLILRWIWPPNTPALWVSAGRAHLDDCDLVPFALKAPTS